MPTFTPTFAHTKAQIGYGDVVAVSVDGGTTLTQVMGTSNIQYSGQRRDMLESTSTTSVGGYKEYIPALKDPGSFTFDVSFDPSDAGQLAVAAAYDSGVTLTVKHYLKAQTGFTTGPIYSFSGTVESFPLPGSDTSKITTLSVSIRISGPITTTAAVPVA